MNSRPSAGVSWLERNKASIKWKLVGPNIQNPFDIAASTERLMEYVQDPSLLKEKCSVQAYMDETTIITVSDLNVFTFSSDHPNILGLTREELQTFLEKSGTWKVLAGDLKKVQEQCKQEIASREVSNSSY